MTSFDLTGMGFSLGETWKKPEPFNLETLGNLPPHRRLAYVREHESELEALSDHDKDEVGLRLVAASPQEVKEEYPVLRERMDPYYGHFMSEQEQFEENVLPVGLLGQTDDEDEDSE